MGPAELLSVLGSLASIISLIRDAEYFQNGRLVTLQGYSYTLDDVSRISSEAGRDLASDPESLDTLKDAAKDPFVEQCVKNAERIKEKMADHVRDHPDRAREIADEGSKAICDTLKAIKRVLGGDLPTDIQVMWKLHGCFDFS